jgi:ribosomal protein L11 methyltransferase
MAATRQPDRWLVLSARAPTDDPLRELLGDGLLALGGLSVVEEGGDLATYLPPPDDPESFVEHAGQFLMEWLLDDRPPELTWRWEENQDWARIWREGLAPRKLTDRLVVKPTWTAWQAEPGEIVIDIDPQMAFGTGEHATTRGCLRLLDRLAGEGDRVLDVGSGSAILAIAAARLGAREVIAVEYDPDANINARENIEQNGVEGRITLMERMGDAELLRELGSFDLILANILSGVIRPLLPAFRDALAPGGRLIVSGILLAEHEEVVADARAAGFEVVDTDPEEEWWSAALRIRQDSGFGIRDSGSA